MNKSIRLLTLAASMLAILSSMGCSKLRARDQLNKGVTAYKNAKYEEAIDHFQQSVALDPTLINWPPPSPNNTFPVRIPRRIIKWRNRPLSNTSECSIRTRPAIRR
jgi:hypothetical protein